MKNEPDKTCIDVFLETKPGWLEKYPSKKINGRYGTYYTITASGKDVNAILRLCRRSGVKTRTYKKQWSRSDDYRSEFLKKTKGPYTCAYCGRNLSKKYLVVDHIIPVAKVKTSAKARRLLIRQGIYDVNDIRNLAASCWRCNKRKGDKMGVWLYRAKHGKGSVLKLTGIIAAVIAAAIIVFMLIIYTN